VLELDPLSPGAPKLALQKEAKPKNQELPSDKGDSGDEDDPED
jgi:hypothetical protein